MATFESLYVLGDELGKGAYATVYKCTHRQTGEVWAVKAVDKSKAGPKDMDDVMHEVNMMKAVAGHEHVVKLKEFFDTPKFMFLVLDLLEGGMLFDRIVKMQHYSERCASRLVKNFLLALQHIHSKGIMHRDLKPENLLLRKNEKAYADDISHLTDVVLADFGLSGCSPGQTCCGSPSYIAPEVINVGYLRKQKEPYDCRCDIFSLGVITYILLSGKMPFHGKNFKEIFAKIVNAQWSFQGDIWDHVTPASKDFVRAMMGSDAKKRPTAAEALKHPWVVDVQPDAHLSDSQTNLKEFNAQQKLRGALLVVRATTSFLGGMNQVPPFMKYLRHKNKMSTVIESQSQTNPDKVHYIDFARAKLNMLPNWKLHDCCTCGSKMVCRHIQNVHEYLYVGSRALDVQPFLNELLSMKDEAACDLQDEPHNAKYKLHAEEIDELLKSAEAFRSEFMKVPADQLKPNFMLQSAAGSSSPAKNPAAIFKKK